MLAFNTHTTSVIFHTNIDSDTECPYADARANDLKVAQERYGRAYMDDRRMLVGDDHDLNRSTMMHARENMYKAYDEYTSKMQ